MISSAIVLFLSQFHKNETIFDQIQILSRERQKDLNQNSKISIQEFQYKSYRTVSSDFQKPFDYEN